MVYPDASGSNIGYLNANGAGVGPNAGAAARTWLEASAPNPSNGDVALSYVLARGQRARVTIVDVSGRLVRTLQAGNLAAGMHRVQWDGRSDSGATERDGVYFCRLASDDGVYARTIVLRR